MGLPIKGVPIRDENTNTIVGQYFEPSGEFKSAVARNMDTVARVDGRTVRVNRKLQRQGHYSDRPGFDIPAEPKIAVVAAAPISTPLQVPMKEVKSK